MERCFYIIACSCFCYDDLVKRAPMSMLMGERAGVAQDYTLEDTRDCNSYSEREGWQIYLTKHPHFFIA